MFLENKLLECGFGSLIIVDGTEISGEFSRKKDVWKRKDELIPDKFKIGAIKWEENFDTPIGEMMSNKQQKTIKQVFEE